MTAADVVRWSLIIAVAEAAGIVAIFIGAVISFRRERDAIAAARREIEAGRRP